MLAYLNGDYVPLEAARISVDDRGFLFGDGVYEVSRVYDGRIYRLADHLARMASGLAALRIASPGLQELGAVAERLLDESGLRTDEAVVYLQVTRGVAPRKHAFPSAARPTVLAWAKPFNGPPPERFTEGAAAIRVPDNRWSRCDIKSISLLANVLANQQAHEADAEEALFVRDGVVIEGSHTNVCAVVGGAVVTYPLCNYVLPGITRAVVFELCAQLGIPAREAPIYDHELFAVEELFLTSTTTEVMPVVRVDGRAIGDGRPGPVTQRLVEAFRASTR